MDDQFLVPLIIAVAAWAATAIVAIFWIAKLRFDVDQWRRAYAREVKESSQMRQLHNEAIAAWRKWAEARNA